VVAHNSTQILPAREQMTEVWRIVQMERGWVDDTAVADNAGHYDVGHHDGVWGPLIPLDKN